MRREASQIIGSAMAEYAQIHLRGMGMLLANPGSSDLLRLINCYPESSSFQGAAVDLGVLGSAKRVWEQSPAIFVASVGLGAMNIAYFALALRGWIRHGVRSSAGFWLVTLTALYFFILSGGPAAVARLRHPLMPCACLLAACGASRKQVSIQIGDAGQSRPSSDRKAA